MSFRRFGSICIQPSSQLWSYRPRAKFDLLDVSSASRHLTDSIWSQVTEPLAPDSINELVDSLGIELDSEEHNILERGPLCQPPSRFGPKKKTALIRPAGVNA
jgi:hypothetical protein